ncbi:pyocin activator PrtN family protein [Xenorhabdus bovienii]|uniref:pyocin activator PrtN family protein n=1 Tax=Xenorhabdus bovienii TaxID=40576 RepID=UPI0023B2F3F4|nr:pyocin activator PrtN family protein [Xenorhabdus bovienii]MDE9545442.1 pyocin activator PrtN family protein [Xenorhabdus bovienii]
MNTTLLLMAEFEAAAIPLSYIAERYLGMKPSTAEQKAALGQLPLPTFRCNNSQKSPRMVHISDLAELIDKKRKESKDEMEYIAKKAKGKSNGTPIAHHKDITH